MNIKSLLLGSAAALVAVSGARAADAVVIAEPEPVEYVRVCDVYGAGYFYIPGTETCLKISGYVWYQIGANGYDGAGDTPGYVGGTVGDGWLKTTRARLNVQAQSETEWGTLQSYIRFQANWGTPSDGAVVTDQAWIALGGLQMGYTESAWAASFKGGATNWGSHSWGGMYYGYAQNHQISYNVLGDSGWGASVGVQVNVPNMPGSSLRVIGYYSDSDNRMGSGTALGVQSEWSVLASYNHQFSPNLGVSVAGQYFSDLYFAGTDVTSGVDAWGAELSAVWTPVTNFEVRPELHYDKVDGLDGTFSGYLRFTRYF